MRRLVRSLMLGTALMSLGGALPIAAAPITMGFTPIGFPTTVSTQDQADLAAVAGQFSVTIDYIAAPQFILDLGYSPTYTNVVSFTFSNTGAIGSNIGEIYWDWTTSPLALLDPTLPPPGGFYEDPSGETWLLEAPPAPGGDVNPHTFPGVNPSFIAEAGADGGSGSTAGLRNNEAPATFYMGLGADPGSGTLADWDMILGSLKSGDIQFGLHVRSIETFNNSSYRFISIPYVEPNDDDPNPVVPVPAGAGLGFLGMALVGVARRKKG